jgi:hypothetical protein
MKDKKIVRCQRCGKRLKKGGDNYRLACSIVADFDGYIDMSVSSFDSAEEIVEEIKVSGMTEKELEEQVYYALNQKLCRDCREEIIAFLKGTATDE